MIEVRVRRAERVICDAAAVSVDMEHLPRHRLLVVGAEGERVHDREARRVPRAHVERAVRGRSHAPDRVRRPLGRDAVHGVRGSRARAAGIRAQQDGLVGKRVAGGELETRQARDRRRVAIRRQRIEVMGVEQVHEAVACERAVHGYPEQAAVPVAVHASRDIEDRAGAARPWVHHLQAPGLLDDEHSPIRRPGGADRSRQAGHHCPLLEPRGICGGAGGARRRARERYRRNGGEEQGAPGA